MTHVLPRTHRLSLFLIAFLNLSGSIVGATVSFDSPKTIYVGYTPLSIAVGDLNYDGCPDLVTVANGIETTAVPVLLGNCDGTFQKPVDYNVGFGPAAVAIADFNSDGIPDLAVADANYYSSPPDSARQRRWNVWRPENLPGAI